MRITRKPSPRPVQNPGHKNPPAPRRHPTQKKTGKSDFDREMEKIEKKVQGAVDILHAMQVHFEDANRHTMAGTFAHFKNQLLEFLESDQGEAGFAPFRKQVRGKYSWGG